jgi:hypothetical protein
VINMLRRNQHPLPQIQPILDGLRRTGSSAALHAAMTQRQASLTEQAAAMLEGSSHLHHYIKTVSPNSGDKDAGTGPPMAGQ